MKLLQRTQLLHVAKKKFLILLRSLRVWGDTRRPLINVYFLVWRQEIVIRIDDHTNLSDLQAFSVWASRAGSSGAVIDTPRMQDSTNCAGYLRDAETSKERNLHHVQDHAEGNRSDKLTGDNREGQWRHGNPVNSER